MASSYSLTLSAFFTLTAFLTGCGGGGGDSGNAATPAQPTPTAPTVTTGGATLYAQTVVLGRTAPEQVGFTDAQGGAGTATIVTPAASTLLAAGSNSLLAQYRNAAVPGAIVACISAPTSSTGVVQGINVGVNVKSVAALLDNTWTTVNDVTTAWAGLAAGGAIFTGWENCGAKPEGQPSPSSLRTLTADGGFLEQVYDGNPSTNLNVIAANYTAAQAAAMLSPAGYLSTMQTGAQRRIRIQILRNAQNQTLLVEQGLPEAGSTAAEPGYLAVYFQR